MGQAAQSFSFRRLRFKFKLCHCLVMGDRTSCLVWAVVVPRRKLCAFIKWWRLCGFHDELRCGRKISVSVHQENIMIWKPRLQKTKTLFILSMCVSTWMHTCVHAHTGGQVPREVRGGCQSPWRLSYYYSPWAAQHGCWGPDSSLLQEQCVLLAAASVFFTAPGGIIFLQCLEHWRNTMDFVSN